MTPHERPTVLIADDHAVWRHGLRDVLEPTFQVVAEAGTGEEAVALALALKPNVVVMDIQMPQVDGISAATQITRALPETGVLMITAADGDGPIHESILAGVRGYITKHANAESVLEAVWAAARGAAYLPPLVAKRVQRGKRSADGTLSPRETEVLRLMAEGYRNKEVGRELGISVRTVSNHVASIYNKLGIDDRAQAVLYAIKKGIIRP